MYYKRDLNELQLVYPSVLGDSQGCQPASGKGLCARTPCGRSWKGDDSKRANGAEASVTPTATLICPDQPTPLRSAALGGHLYLANSGVVSNYSTWLHRWVLGPASSKGKGWTSCEATVYEGCSPKRIVTIEAKEVSGLIFNTCILLFLALSKAILEVLSHGSPYEM